MQHFVLHSEPHRRAAEMLLEARLFDEIKISEICRVAGRSVGASYARFGDKDGLLQELDERYLRHIIAVGNTLVSQTLPSCRTLRDATHAVVDALYAVYGGRPGLMRSLILRSRTKPEGRIKAGQEAARSLIPPVLSDILRFRDAIVADDPREEIEAYFVSAAYTIRETLLWSADRSAARQPRSVLVGRVAHGMWAALTTRPFASSPEPYKSPFSKKL